MAIPLLYWRSIQLASEAIESDSDIWSVIQQQMKAVGLLDVKKNPSDVNGHTKDTIVAVTFVKLAQKDYMVIIMAAGNSALAIRDKLYKGLKNVAFL